MSQDKAMNAVSNSLKSCALEDRYRRDSNVGSAIPLNTALDQSPLAFERYANQY